MVDREIEETNSLQSHSKWQLILMPRIDSWRAMALVLLTSD